MTKIIDIQQSITAANGNISLAKELLTMFLDELELRKQQIKESHQSNDMEQLEEHIHKLYGATAYCIVPSLRNNTNILEQALKSKNHTKIEELVEMVQQDIQHVLKNGPVFLKMDWIKSS